MREVMRKKQQNQEQKDDFSRSCAGAHLGCAGDHLEMQAPVWELRWPHGVVILESGFSNLSSTGLLTVLFLVDFYISNLGRRFTITSNKYQSSKEQGEKIKKTILAHRNEEEEAYVIL